MNHPVTRQGGRRPIACRSRTRVGHRQRRVVRDVSLTCSALRFEATGRVVPLGHNVKKPALFVFVTVAFTTTAATPFAGIPARPRTGTVTWAPAVGLYGPPLAGSRVSMSR